VLPDPLGLQTDLRTCSHLSRDICHKQDFSSQAIGDPWCSRWEVYHSMGDPCPPCGEGIMSLGHHTVGTVGLDMESRAKEPGLSKRERFTP
jgi:hypothetical protein